MQDELVMTIKSYGELDKIPEYLKKEIYEILDLIEAFCIIVYTKDNSNNILNTFKNILKDKYKVIEDKYYKENKIYNLDLDINYDLSIKDFLKELNNIRLRYIDYLDSIVKLEVGRMVVKYKINDRDLIQKYIDLIKNDYKNKNKYLDMMKDDIKRLLANKKKYEELKEEVKDIDNEDIKKKLKDLGECLSSWKFQELVLNIEELMRKYREYKDNKLIVLNLYNKIRELFIKRINNINPVDNYLELNNILNMYKYIINIFKKYSLGLIKLEALLLLDNISFLDNIEDKNIIRSVNSNLSYVSMNEIYVRKNIVSPVGLYKNKEFVYEYNQEIRKDAIGEDYDLMYLGDYLDKAEFKVYKGIIKGFIEVIGLYNYEGITICLINNKLEINYNLKIKKITDISREDYLKYKDKDYIINEIQQELDTKLNNVLSN